MICANVEVRSRQPSTHLPPEYLHSNAFNFGKGRVATFCIKLPITQGQQSGGLQMPALVDVGRSIDEIQEHRCGGCCAATLHVPRYVDTRARYCHPKSHGHTRGILSTGSRGTSSSNKLWCELQMTSRSAIVNFVSLLCGRNPKAATTGSHGNFASQAPEVGWICFPNLILI